VSIASLLLSILGPRLGLRLTRGNKSSAPGRAHGHSSFITGSTNYTASSLILPSVFIFFLKQRSTTRHTLGSKRTAHAQRPTPFRSRQHYQLLKTVCVCSVWVPCVALPSGGGSFVGPSPLCWSPVWVPCAGPLCGSPLWVPSVWVPCVGPSSRCVMLHLLA